MSDYLNIASFLNPVNLQEIAGDDLYKKDQMGYVMSLYEEEFPDLEKTDIVFIGCGEQRGKGVMGPPSMAPNVIRKHFYSLFFWHEGIRLADIGDIRQGATYNDTLVAL